MEEEDLRAAALAEKLASPDRVYVLEVCDPDRDDCFSVATVHKTWDGYNLAKRAAKAAGLVTSVSIRELEE